MVPDTHARLGTAGWQAAQPAGWPAGRRILLAAVIKAPTYCGLCLQASGGAAEEELEAALARARQELEAERQRCAMLQARTHGTGESGSWAATV